MPTSFPPALKALLAQTGGWGVVWALGWPDSIWTLALIQACAATLIAALLHSARWWLPIHLTFTPLAFAVQTLGVPPVVWLVAFIVFALIYWSSYRTQVPLFLTNSPTARVLAGLLPTGPVLDLGCGTGSLLVALKRQCRDAHLTGVESAPAPYLIARWRMRKHPDVSLIRGDFFNCSWAEYELVYAFLSPAPMPEVWEKARREMKPGTLLVSNSFGIPHVEPLRVIEVADRRHTRLLVFRIPGT